MGLESNYMYAFWREKEVDSKIWDPAENQSQLGPSEY